MRDIHIAHLDKTQPVVVLTRSGKIAFTRNGKYRLGRTLARGLLRETGEWLGLWSER